jgi:fibronectin type 3 domain-containing protein
MLLRALLSLLIAISIGAAWGQGGTGIAALALPDGVALRWYLPDGRFPDGGFRLYRSGGGVDRVIAVPAPLPRDLAVRMSLGEETFLAYVAELFKGAAADEDVAIERAFVQILALADPRIAEALGTLHRDRGLSPGVTYSYRVVAVSGGRERELGRVTVTPGPSPPVPVPGGLEARPAPGSIELRWRDPGGLTVAYRILRGRDAEPLQPLSAEPYLPGGAEGADGEAAEWRSYRDETFEAGATYRYAVVAIDLFGRESGRSPEISVDPALARPLEAPALTRVEAGDRRIELAWGPVTDERVTSVVVLRATELGGPLDPVASLPAGSRGYVDAAVIPGVFYYYAAAVRSSAGELARGPVQAVLAVNLHPPAAPRGLNAVAGEAAITLTWSPGSEPDLAGYLVYRAEGAGPASGEYLLITAEPVAGARFEDELEAGSTTRYHYRVEAVNTSNVRSRPSDVAAAVLVDRTPPDAPVLLDASGLEGGIGLAWSAGFTPDLAGFEIFRVGPDGRTVLVDTVAPDTVGYVDRTVVPNVTYAYAVAAVDHAGNRSEASNPQLARAFLSRPPEAPPGVRVAPLATGYRVTWEHRPDLAYVVYRTTPGSAPVAIAGPMIGGAHDDPDGWPGVSYGVRALDASGNQSPLSELIEAP